MAVRGVLPSTLLRSLQRLAVRDSDADAVSGDGGAFAAHGLLLGGPNRAIEGENEVAIWGVVRDIAEGDDVLPLLPRGIAAIGVFSVWIRGGQLALDDEDAERDAAAAIATAALARASSFSPPVALVYVHESQRVHLFDRHAAAASLEIVECLHASDFALATDSVVLRTSLSFHAHTVDELAKWRAQLENADATTAYFQFPEKQPSLFDARGVDAAQGVSAVATSELLSAFVKIPEKRAAAAAGTSKSKKKKAALANDNWDTSETKKSGAVSSGDFLSVDTDGEARKYVKTLEYGNIADVLLLRSLAFSPSTDALTAPCVEMLPTKPSSATAQRPPTLVHADALIVVSQAASITEVVAALRAELAKQLARLETEWTSSATSLRSDHFALVGASFPLTLPVVNGELAASVPAARSLAEQLVQPLNRPLFNASRCSLASQAAALADIDVMFNVHEGLSPSGVPNGTQYLVDGFYGYYHYLQQAMNDKGWGCAYRSLQTLASWLFWNHYTTRPTLSHREIQQTLVQIGDKPAAFVGSRDWIGSMEVGFVLDEQFGISFRTLNVASGPQLVEQAQELKHHFETQGTPVMMGGGQLAFTLLGIDYNASSGECAFLILDPHYVGADDLEAIQTKTVQLEGYKAVPCSWRKAASFSKSSFYNLCLPQRPHME